MSLAYEDALLFQSACNVLNNRHSAAEAQEEAIVALGMLREGAAEESMKHRARFALSRYMERANETPRSSEVFCQQVDKSA